MEKMRKWLEILMEAADASEKMAGIIDDNLAGSLVQELNSAWEALSETLGEVSRILQFEQRLSC